MASDLVVGSMDLLAVIDDAKDVRPKEVVVVDNAADLTDLGRDEMIDVLVNA